MMAVRLALVLVLVACNADGGEPGDPPLDEVDDGVDAGAVDAATPVPVPAPVPVDDEAREDCELSGLIAYYPFDGDTLDRSWQHRDIASLRVEARPGRFGGSYAFDGRGSSMRITGDGALVGARTLCAWVSPGHAAGPALPVFAVGAPGQMDRLALQVHAPSSCASAAVGAPLIAHGDGTCLHARDLAAPEHAWSLVCYGVDGDDNAFVAVDGVRRGVMARLLDAKLAAVRVGGDGDAVFDGLIDEVTLWDHALGARELRALFGGGRGCAP